MVANEATTRDAAELGYQVRPVRASSESGTIPAGVIASRCGGNFVRQIPFGLVAFHPMMAADEIECADEAAVAPAIAQAASDPALAVAEEFQ